jgi:hypothetical protein
MSLIIPLILITSLIHLMRHLLRFGYCLLAISIVLSLLVALFYLVEEFLNSVERFAYDEGCSKASVSIAAMFLGALCSNVLAIVVVMMPVISLFLAVNVANPLVISVLAVVSLTLIGAGLTCFLANLAYDKFITTNNSDAINSIDAHRHAITAKQEEELIKQNLNPIKVKCAIISLHEKIGEQSVPSLLVRFFTEKGQKKQHYLDQIRQLKTGQLKDILIDSMVFDLRQDKEDSNDIDSLEVNFFNKNQEPQISNFILATMFPSGPPLFPP